MDSPEDQRRIGLEQIVVWVGDQLTIERLQGLQRFRCEDVNSFLRLDWMVLMYGWLHAMMQMAYSLNKQHYGTLRGRGLAHAYEKLGRQRLEDPKTKGPYCWLLAAQVDSLHALREKRPSELRELAQEKHDAVKLQSTMLTRDLLQYIVLLFRFVGGNNFKYAILVLELLQGLRREWPAELGYGFHWHTSWAELR